jgi:hypothetical protein
MEKEIYLRRRKRLDDISLACHRSPIRP